LSRKLTVDRFQYVVCQLSVLRDCLTGPTVEAALANLPTGIDETYDRMLLSIKFENCEQVRRALLVIAFSVRPMRCEEVAEFAVIAGSFKPFAIGDRLFDPKDIIGLAAGFIIYDEITGSLMLAHYSVKEYLLSSRIMIGRARYFGLLELTAHQYITEASVSYMLSVANLTLGYHGITQDYPFLQYAAANWVQHARYSLKHDAFSVIELALHMLDGRNGAYTFWLTYHDSFGKNRTALESLLEYLHSRHLLVILRHPGLVYLPSDIIVAEVCALFMRVDISNRSTTSAQRIINAKAEMLNIVRRLYHPISNFYRLKMFRKVCLMDAGNASPDWEPLNEAMYLALFEPLDFTGLDNPPEMIPFQEVELEGEQLQPFTAAIEAREPHENRFSHVLEYISRRISEASVEGDVRDVTESDEGPPNAQLDSQPTATVASDGSWQVVHR
jgi:hypothetical protein